MNVLIIYAHPEPTSLNGSLKDFAVQRLEAAGHQVQVSDLYAMQWKAPLDAGDTLERRPGGVPFHPSLDSKHAFERGLQYLIDFSPAFRRHCHVLRSIRGRARLSPHPIRG